MKIYPPLHIIPPSPPNGHQPKFGFGHLENTNPRTEGFLKWIVRLKASCLQAEEDICTEVLSKAGGNVRTFLMGVQVNLLWSSVWQELKRWFSNLPTAAHVTVSLNTIVQKPNESLHIYICRYSRLHYAYTDKTS